MRRFGKWTPARCGHWRSLPHAERPAFERWVRDAPDWPALPPGAASSDTGEGTALSAWLEAEPFARLYLTLIIAGYHPDRLREMYRKDFSLLDRRRGETRRQWLDRLRTLLERQAGDE